MKHVINTPVGEIEAVHFNGKLYVKGVKLPEYHVTPWKKPYKCKTDRHAISKLSRKDRLERGVG